MAYLGGKSIGYKNIIQILNNPYFDGTPYIEPFVGYAHILRRVTDKSSYTASDNNENLFNLLTFVKGSGRYPKITKEEYLKLKTTKDKRLKFRKAFAAFCYSYCGKEFGGFVEKNEKWGRNYPEQIKRYYDQLRSNVTFMNTKLHKGDYTMWMNSVGSVIYCDPPYENTTSYGNNNFDHSLFWKNMRKLSKKNWVFISEYNAPPDFICISATTKNSSIRGAGAVDARIEKLYIHKSRYRRYLTLGK